MPNYRYEDVKDHGTLTITVINRRTDFYGKHIFLNFAIFIPSLSTQGVLKVRKRVTLMIVTVSVIFGICWFTDLTLHVIEQASSYKFNRVVFSIAHTMIMFNSAVNPFAYALINQRFREKIKAMICCSSTRPRIQAAREPRGIELAKNTIQSSDVPQSDAVEMNGDEFAFGLREASCPTVSHLIISVITSTDPSPK